MHSLGTLCTHPKAQVSVWFLILTSQRAILWHECRAEQTSYKCLMGKVLKIKSARLRLAVLRGGRCAQRDSKESLKTAQLCRSIRRAVCASRAVAVSHAGATAAAIASLSGAVHTIPSILQSRMAMSALRAV